MKLTMILNRDIDLGKLMNALAHMTMGLGHRLEGEPDVEVYFGNTAQVRQFRTIAAAESKENPETVAFSDFPHTMSGVTGGRSHDQVANTAKTAEADYEYFGSCFVSDEANEEIEKIVKSCAQLKGYTPYKSKGSANLLEETEGKKDDNVSEKPDKKITMAINGKPHISQTINAAVLASLSVGRSADLKDLCLEQLKDKEGNIHPNISFHPYTVVKCDSAAKLATAAKRADEAKKGVASNTQKTLTKDCLVTVAFGDRESVEKIFTKDLTTLFRSTLKPDDLVNSSPANAESIPANSNKESKRTEKPTKQNNGDTSQAKKALAQSPATLFKGSQKQESDEKVDPQLEAALAAAMKQLNEAADALKDAMTSFADKRSKPATPLQKPIEKTVSIVLTTLSQIVGAPLVEAASANNMAVVELIMPKYKKLINYEDYYSAVEVARISGYKEIHQHLVTHSVPKPEGSNSPQYTF